MMPYQAEFSVSQLNLMIADAVRHDPRLRSITVRGEISGFKLHIASGHWYFSLKDEAAAVSCVMFRQNNMRAPLRPKDGQSVIVTGYVDVYPKSGSLQLYVMTIREAGTGDMHARFEALKQKLYAEGLFDQARKKTLPLLPRKVAVVTSESGAAIRDILNVSAARSPFVPMTLVPVIVQGDRAAAEISAGIRKAWNLPDVDVVIVARGGGSAEDLWCFNEEIVARAVAECPVPVVSGVGHEIDTTICDLAADARASTPSNAAEMVFPDRKELRGRTRALALQLAHAAVAQVQNREIMLRDTYRILTALSPERRIADLSARSRLNREMLDHAIRMRTEENRNRLSLCRTRINHAMTMRSEAAGMTLLRLREKLEAMNPLGILDRGYALVYDMEGRILPRKAEAAGREHMVVRFADGEIEVQQHG